MNPYYTLSVGDRELKLKMTTATKIDAERKLGFSLLDAPEQITRAEVFAVVLWAALQKYQSNFPMQKVYDLIDDMEEEGFTISEKADLMFEIMKVSGFFSPEQLEEMEAEKESRTARKKTPGTKKGDA